MKPCNFGSIVALCSLSFIMVVSSSADIPKSISYQGKITDSILGDIGSGVT